MARTNPLIKVGILLVVLTVVGFLFMRSLRDSRAVPYTVEPEELRTWTLVLEPESGPNSPMLTLQASPDLGLGLFRQAFTRAGESLARPRVPAIPIVLHDEFNRLLAGRVTPDALLATVRNTGIESAPPALRCMAYRRVSEPGGTRQLYFVMFEAEAFRRIRADIGVDANALSPVLFVAGADGDFNRWLPLRADPDADCVAPIATTGPVP